MNQALKLFEDKNVRALWDELAEKWYFSIIDVVGILSESSEPRRYWSDLKIKLRQESGNTELYDKIVQLKMLAPDGKMRETDTADIETVFRIIQSIPSPKAEPFKLWLAQVGAERLDEIADPEIAIHRALEYYRRLGYSEGWIVQRLKSIEIRKELTNEWDRGGVRQGLEYAILTDEMTNAWAGMNAREYKKVKDLKKESLRDNMTNAELVLNMLAELSTTEIARTEKPIGFDKHLDAAQRGGAVAGLARRRLESETGKSVITGKNAKELKRLK